MKQKDWAKKRSFQAKNIGEILLEFIQKNKLSQGIDNVHIQEVWQKIGGVALYNYTQKIELKGSILFVTLTSPALRNELSYKKNNLVVLLNKELGKEVISEIFFK